MIGFAIIGLFVVAALALLGLITLVDALDLKWRRDSRLKVYQ